MRIKTGTTSECVKFAKGTQPELEGWWYHSCKEHEAKKLVNGVLDNPDLKSMHFSRADTGAVHKHHTHVVAATVNTTDPQKFKHKDPQYDGLQQGHWWLDVWDDCVMIGSGSKRKLPK